MIGVVVGIELVGMVIEAVVISVVVWIHAITAVVIGCSAHHGSPFNCRNETCLPSRMEAAYWKRLRLGSLGDNTLDFCDVAALWDHAVGPFGNGALDAAGVLFREFGNGY